MLSEYARLVAERAALGVPPKPLDADQVGQLVALLEKPPPGEAQTLLALFTHRVSPGVDPAARIKAGFLSDLAKRRARSPLIDPRHAVALLGTMQGGYNVPTLIELLDDPELGAASAEPLSRTLLVFDHFHDVASRAKRGDANAGQVLRSWADASWFTARPEVPETIRLRTFFVPGETNTDDLSPATEAWSRPDVPLHAQSFLCVPREGVDAPIACIAAFRANGDRIVYAGDVVGTGSSRKSAVNSLLWHLGDDIPHVPNRRTGGVVLAGKIAPIFFDTLQDSGALPIECDVSALSTGDAIELLPQAGRVVDDSGRTITEFESKSDVLLDAVRAGGRIPLILGRQLTDRAREVLGEGPSPVFRRSAAKPTSQGRYTLAQKMVGRACGVAGVSPGSYCEPRVSTVGSQDTTGPMTRDELEGLACLGFSADLVLQSFCHTVAYPKPVDLETQQTLPGFMTTRGGVSLRPGDGIIHSWLNRMLLPDQVGTGADSHTRFPLGISFPAGSGLVAFAAATGVMPLDMPESVLVRFVGERRPGITLRDLVHAIPYTAIRRGLLTLGKRGKRNVFSGRVLEIEGLADLAVEQAFELADATAERSSAGCTIALSEATVSAHLRENAALLRSMIDDGYADARTLERRVEAMRAWLAEPALLCADSDARYAAVLEIDQSEIVEPLLACPNDPDDVRPLGEIAGKAIDEVFIGSCMTSYGHFEAARRLLAAADRSVPTRLWLAPPTKLDEARLRGEGAYATYERAGARIEVPGCSLCMGNQARVADGATVVSTSTRNFPNRLGRGANVYLASAEVAALSALLGRLPDATEYRQRVAAA